MKSIFNIGDRNRLQDDKWNVISTPFFVAATDVQLRHVISCCCLFGVEGTPQAPNRSAKLYRQNLSYRLYLCVRDTVDSNAETLNDHSALTGGSVACFSQVAYE